MINVSHFKIGEVINYFASLSIAIVQLTADIHVGDRVKFSGSTDFSQIVSHLQIEHLQVDFAKSGEVVGLKVRQPVTAGDELVKLV